MKTMQIKKSVFVSTVLACSLLFGAVGVYAGNGVEAVKANLNHNIKFSLNGSSWALKDNKGNKMAPLVYNNSTYVPLRAVSEALGAEVNLDVNTMTISINTADGDSGIPYNDVSNPTKPSTPNPPSSNQGSSASGKTIGDAIPLGQSVTYSDPYSYSSLAYNGSYTVSVTSVKPITAAKIGELGFRVDSDSNVEYRMVKLKVNMKNGKLISSDGSTQYVSVNLMPEIWGSWTSGGEKIIGGTDYGFTGSLRDEVKSASGDKQMSVGQTYSYSAEGSIILPVQKGKKNFLTLQLNNTDDYDNSFIYFALE